ncbi:MAG: hypothetical protein IJQ31_08015 [Thermoguttaceae bacterium]|nr:hypothetical protein [Thermoguttaceae bacterium]
MNEEQNKLQKLMEIFNCETSEDLEEVTRVRILGDTKFQTLENLGLLTFLPKLEAIWLKQIPDSLTVEELLRVIGEWKDLDSVLLACGTMTPSLMEGLLGLKNIKAFYFNKVEYDEAVLDTLRGQNHLKTLKFDVLSPLPGNFLDVLGTLPQLEVLDLGTGRPEVVEPLSILAFAKEHLPNIKTLIWPTSYLSGKEIETMISMELETFEFRLTGLAPEYEDFSFLNRFRSLKNLHLMCPAITRIDWDLPNLKSLFIADAPDVRYMDFSGMPHLKTVSFMDVGMISLFEQEDEDDDPEEEDEDDYQLHFEAEFEGEPNVEFKGLELLKELEVFKLSNVPSDRPLIPDLKDSTELCFLELSKVFPLKPDDIPYVNNLKKLKRLDVDLDESISIQDIEKLSGFPELRSLELFSANRQGIVKAFVSKCPKLKELDVYGKPGDEDVQALTSMNSLREITLDDCSNVGAENINAIFSMKKLKSISLVGASNETLEVRDFPHLDYIELSEWKYLMEASFANLPALDDIPLTCPVLESLKIKDLPNLRSLKIQNCPFLYFLLFHNVPKISFLNVLGSPNMDLTALIRLQGLEKLEMTLEQLHQDFVLETLQELPNLRNLIIDCDQQKDGQEINYEIIKDSPAELWKSNCSLEERERIQKALPNCEIQFGYDKGISFS